MLGAFRPREQSNRRQQLRTLHLFPFALAALIALFVALIAARLREIDPGNVR